MPSVSAKQAKLMSAIKHGWQPPAGMHAPSLAVAREFHAADKREGKFMHAEGGKVAGLKAALNAIEGRLPTAAEVLARKASQLGEPGHDPYNTADAMAKKAAAHAAAEEFMPGLISQDHWAEGGAVEGNRPWRHRSGAPFQGQSTDANRFLQLVSHAADRATSTVTDDPHHVLARVASGLASQVAGRTPTGGVAFGRLPNLVDEIKSLPAGLTDVGMVGSNVLGALAHKYLPHEPGSLGDVLPRLASAANAYAAKHGDPAPDWSRAAEERANAVHQTVNKDMGLSAPHGFVENAADATGVMLGQLPIPLGEAKTATRGVRGGLAALARAVPEYLGPTVRPSIRNYATGALGGGAMGALADQPDQNYYGGGRVSDVGNKIDWLTKKLGDLFASSPPPQPPTN